MPADAEMVRERSVRPRRAHSAARADAPPARRRSEVLRSASALIAAARPARKSAQLASELSKDSARAGRGGAAIARWRAARAYTLNIFD